MFRLFLSVLTALTVSRAASTEYATPPPIFAAREYTTWAKTYAKSKYADIKVPFVSADGQSDEVFMSRVDLYGTAKERGFAHGALLADQIVEFVRIKLPEYYANMIMSINVNTDGLPEALQKMLTALKVKGALKAPEVFNKALAWVYETEEKYMPQELIDEMDSIAEGVCSVIGSKCNITEWTETIRTVNMLPELIRMACTAFGAWGEANVANGKLVQLRALDFGSGPFANYSVVQVHRNAGMRPFASVSFPGFVGVVTGISQNGIGISEKVWMTYDKYSLQPGSYEGEPDVFVLRDILQYSETRAEAEEYLVNAKRTWGIWVGLGDFKTQVFDLVGYRQEDVVVYTDYTMPEQTGQPFIKSVAYVDKHPQPSGDGPTGSLPTSLSDFYGNITAENTRVVAQYHQTGDVHIAVYDYGANEMLVSIGRVNGKGQYQPDGGEGEGEVWKAYNRPYLRFSLDDLWGGF